MSTSDHSEVPQAGQVWELRVGSTVDQHIMVRVLSVVEGGFECLILTSGPPSSIVVPGGIAIDHMRGADGTPGSRPWARIE